MKTTKKLGGPGLAFTAWRRGWGVPLLVLLGSAGCSLDGLLNSDQLPNDVSDPAITKTPNGARAAYHGTLDLFRVVFAGEDDRSFVVQTGLLTDELVAVNGSTVDQRALPETAPGGVAASNGVSSLAETYTQLHKVRGNANQAIGLLADYVPDQPELRGHLYALEGYAEIFLAELYCSGVPLGTMDYDGDFTYRPGSNTTAVFQHAVALFDTAIALSGDSARFVDLARVGQARALLGTGAYAAAAAVAAAVPEGYQYAEQYADIDVQESVSSPTRNFAYAAPGSPWSFSVEDHEGVNGMDWRTSGDPRTPIAETGDSTNGVPNHRPVRYPASGATSTVVASAIEARLIEAEAALQAGSGTWLTILNALRTDSTFDTTETMPSDTLWHAGSGGEAGLAPLPDPGTLGARVDLLFRERAFWLFLTGHRQGDLRRLIRGYGRTENALYPIGPYSRGFTLTGPYGADVTAPIPEAEYSNPLYTGCASRGA